MSQLHDSDSDLDASDTGQHQRPNTFRERHALKVMGAIMVAMLTLVIIAQVAC